MLQIRRVRRKQLNAVEFMKKYNFFIFVIPKIMSISMDNCHIKFFNKLRDKLMALQKDFWCDCYELWNHEYAINSTIINEMLHPRHRYIFLLKFLTI